MAVHLAVAVDIFDGALFCAVHLHCNKVILDFINHRQTGIITAIFKGTPTEVVQHRGNTVI